MQDISPRVTIVIPVYNRLRYLSETINSVLSQVYQDWKLIVVDDGSLEDVGAFISQFDDPRISFLRQANQGNATARNAGIERSTGEFIACLDSDDVWHPGFLKACVEYLDNKPKIDVAYTKVQTIDEDGDFLPSVIESPPPNGDLLAPLLLGFPLVPSSTLARSSCFRQWGPYTAGLDDWELWLRWSGQGCTFACIERPLTYYRVHDQNFNLDFDRRRELQFAMLDKFYKQEKLPEIAHQLREKAYAKQHFYFAVLAWQLDRPAEGLDEFREAVLRQSSYLVDLDFLTRIACAYQGRFAGSDRGFDIKIAEKTLFYALNNFFSGPDLPFPYQRIKNRSRAWAFLALGRLAYGIARDMPAARSFFLNGLRAWPTILWSSDWFLWLGRSLLGYEKVQAFKHIRDLKSTHA